MRARRELHASMAMARLFAPAKANQHARNGYLQCANALIHVLEDRVVNHIPPGTRLTPRIAHLYAEWQLNTSWRDDPVQAARRPRHSCRATMFKQHAAAGLPCQPWGPLSGSAAWSDHRVPCELSFGAKLKSGAKLFSHTTATPTLRPPAPFPAAHVS